MKHIPRLSLAALAAAVVILPLLMAPGGFPSRPRFHAVGIGTTAPSQVGSLKALANFNGDLTHTIDNDSNASSNLSRIIINSGDVTTQWLAAGSGRVGVLLNGGPSTGAQAALRTDGAYPLLFGTSNTLAATISAAQVMDFVNTPTIAGSAIALVSSVPVVTTGSFTGAVTGCTTDPAPSITYSKISESSGQGIVTLHIPSFQCTSNTTGFTITGAPAVLDPGAADSAHTNGRVTDDSVITVDGYVRMNASNVIVVRLRAGDALWTASNFKGIANSIQMIYDTR